MRTIIVGAGSSGAVIAARLTEDPRHEVVLVEAGPDYPRAAEDPETLPNDLRDGRQNSLHAHDWGLWYRAVDHKAWGLLPMGFPRGKVVGGSSAVNTCIALRGQPFDYDEWGARGLSDWSWEKCLPYFKRLETDLDFENEWHGKNGPIPIRRHKPEELVRWQRGFLEACASIGMPSCADTNDPTTTGAGPHAMNKINGERMSAARCYLTSRVRARVNLELRAETLVRRVIVRNGLTQGVEVEKHGRVFELFADRVVLCGGAIASPGILLRSGIGPENEVARLGVSLVKDVPGVGARLLDHPGLAIFFKPHEGDLCSLEHPLIQTVCRYTSKDSECPNDMQIQPGSFVPVPHMPLRSVTLACCVGKPRGEGRIRFHSANPHDRPTIETALLSHPDDLARANEALSKISELADTKAISSLARPVYPARKPFDKNRALRSSPFQITGSGYHPSGTLPMGADADPLAVTDGRGRVRGVRGLFVCDASLMPTIPSANTNVPTLMMGERFGEWLREADAR